MAVGITTSHFTLATLADLLNLIETILIHVEIYTQVPPTPAMDNMVIKIMLEFFSTLALATRELNQGQPSHSVPCSQIHKEIFQRYGD